MRKSRTRQRREVAATTTARAAPPPAQRSTFRVAQAQRELAVALPSVVRNRQAERRAATPSRVQTVAPLSNLQDETNRANVRAPRRNAPAQPTLATPPKSGVCRPRGGPKSGGGSGRSFVPFNKDC